MLLLGVVVGYASCAGAQSAIAPRKPLLGVVERARNGSALLARLDPRSLQPVSRKVEVGEYHRAWSLSPDASHLALGVGGKGIGIKIVDLRTMRLARKIRTGIAAEALAWIGPRRLVAALQRGGTVLVDPLSGRILRRWSGFSFPDASTPIRNGLVMLLPRLRKSSPGLPLIRVAGPPRLAVVEAPGRLRSVTLERIRLGVRVRAGVYYADRAGLAVDFIRARAYVLAADAPVATVDLRSMRVSYHRLEPLFLRPRSRLVARERGAFALGSRYVVVFGRDFVSGRGRKEPGLAPAGAAVLKPADWSWRTLDRAATGATFAANRVLAYGPGQYPAAGIGVRAYLLGGRRVFSLFKGKRVFDVRLASGWAYVRTPKAVYVVDVASGKVVREIVPPVDLVDVIVRRS